MDIFGYFFPLPFKYPLKRFRENVLGRVGATFGNFFWLGSSCGFLGNFCGFFYLKVSQNSKTGDGDFQTLARRYGFRVKIFFHTDKVFVQQTNITGHEWLWCWCAIWCVTGIRARFSCANFRAWKWLSGSRRHESGGALRVEMPEPNSSQPKKKLKAAAVPIALAALEWQV